MSLLDGIVNAILGPDPRMMTEEDRRKAEATGAQHRKEASSSAVDARTNPGEQFMDGPEKAGYMDSGSLGDTIGKIMKLFSGGGG